jgi:hypothetical protein
LGYAYGITNIEYTEFKRLGIRDEAQSEGSRLSVFPANTNVLYLGLQARRRLCGLSLSDCRNRTIAAWCYDT